MVGLPGFASQENLGLLGWSTDGFVVARSLVIFGKDAVFCPPAAECYCKLYGHCELACKAGTCDGRYFTPKSAALPDGWPRIGWSGEERNYTGLE